MTEVMRSIFVAAAAAAEEARHMSWQSCSVNIVPPAAVGCMQWTHLFVAAAAVAAEDWRGTVR